MTKKLQYFAVAALSLFSLQANAVTSADAARAAIRELDVLVQRGRVDPSYANVHTVRVFDGTVVDDGAQFSVSVSPFAGWDVGINEVRLNITSSGRLKSHRVLPVVLPRELPQWPELTPTQYISLAFEYLRNNAANSKELSYFDRSLAIVSIRKLVEHDSQVFVAVEMQSLEYMMPLRIIYDLSGSFVRHEFL